MVTRILDFVGTFAFAISGIRLASTKQMDWFGAYVLGVTTAVGGGTPVSYTHLDVYKRQWMKCSMPRACSCSVQAGLPATTNCALPSSSRNASGAKVSYSSSLEQSTTMSALAATAASIPVSYTHLDVYKRQGVC